jgi:phenylacetate-CoA ligase
MTLREPGTPERLLNAFRRAAAEMPWYRTLLDEHAVSVDQVVDIDSFSSCCPILTRRNTFDRFPLEQLAATTTLADLAGVLTSSGHGGRFSFGLQTRAQAAAGGRAIDQALDAAFQIGSRSTLAINCLPMGVGFASERMTVATTSVREDMAVALIQAFGASYDQILLVADPLFLKRLLDHADAQRTDWSRYRVHVVLGEEIFGEHFRDYVAGCLGHDVDHPERGYIASSFGVGELGLHLCFETPATIALRRAAFTDRLTGLYRYEYFADALPRDSPTAAPSVDTTSESAIISGVLIESVVPPPVLPVRITASPCWTSNVNCEPVNV